jgi:hypothetical protein
MKEISEVGQFVCNSSKSARFHENGILKYAQTVTELDISFLEQIRDEVALGMDAFGMIASMDEPTSVKQVSRSEVGSLPTPDIEVGQAFFVSPHCARKDRRSRRGLLWVSVARICIQARS